MERRRRGGNGRIPFCFFCVDFLFFSFSAGALTRVISPKLISSLDSALNHAPVVACHKKTENHQQQINRNNFFPMYKSSDFYTISGKRVFFLWGGINPSFCLLYLFGTRSLSAPRRKSQRGRTLTHARTHTQPKVFARPSPSLTF